MVLIDGLGPNIDALETPTKKPKNFLLGVFKDVLLVIFFSFCVFLFINFPAITLIGTYKLSPTKLAYNFPSDIEQKTVVVQGKNPESAPKVNQYPNDTIFIPKIGVKAPVGWGTESEEIAEALEENVVHLEGTDRPGGPGNIFLTGHSSNYWWKEGEYNTVFALLPELKEEDEIIITYKGEFYYYKVTELKEVKKEEAIDYVESGRPRLTLMTCVPVGTNLKRLLVFAEPVK